MDLKGLSGGLYKPLSAEDINTIHEAALTILENIGITYESGLDATLELLEKHGAAVDRDHARVRIPREMVLAQAKKAPENVILYSRDGKNDLDLNRHRVYLGTGGAAIRIIDLESGESRPSTLEDLFSLGRLVDHLDNIHFFLRPCIPTDIPEAEYDVNCFFACLKATGKHVMSGLTSEEGLHTVMALASMLAGDADTLRQKPFFSVVTSFAISPLKLCTQSTLIMQEATRNRIPVALSSAPMAGSTSPLTMAGTLAQLHAEQLAGITICQLTAEGAPILYGGIPGRANLSSMDYLGGSVECGMMNAAIHQMAHHIRVPNYNSAGLSDSKVPDAQAAWEKGITILLAALGGSNYVHHAAGMLESMLAVSYEQFVIDDEIIGMCCKALKGIQVDADHLALEVIDEVGPGGNYMTVDHTMKYLRDEYYNGNGVSDRKGRVQWEEEGCLDARSRARQMAQKILAEAAEPYIPEQIERKVRERFNILL